LRRPFFHGAGRQKGRECDGSRFWSRPDGWR